MEKHFKKLIDELNKNLHFLSLEQTNIFKRCEESIEICVRALDQCTVWINEKDFRTKEEEIKFFKEIKPLIASKLQFYLMLFKLEKTKPLSESAQKEYYEKELANIDHYSQLNLEFIIYYRTGRDHFDLKYFTRGQADINLLAEDYYFICDKNTNTTHDSKVARVLAYEQLAAYIRNAIKKLDNSNLPDRPKPMGANLVWTDSKVSLIELIYALHTSGSFNRGTLELKELAETLSTMFNIELGDFYRTWSEIKIRKESTKYIDTLKFHLENKIKIDLQ